MATSPTEPTARLIDQRLAEGESSTDLARRCGVSVDALNAIRTGAGSPEAAKRVRTALTLGAIVIRDDPLARAGDRLCQAISHAFVHLPERPEGHTHILNSPDLCCRMSSSDDLAVDRARVERAVHDWHTARRAAS